MKDSTAKLLALGVIGSAIWYYLRKRGGGSLLSGSLDGLGAKMTKEQQWTNILNDAPDVHRRIRVYGAAPDWIVGKTFDFS